MRSRILEKYKKMADNNPLRYFILFTLIIVISLCFAVALYFANLFIIQIADVDILANFQSLFLKLHPFLHLFIIIFLLMLVFLMTFFYVLHSLEEDLKNKNTSE